MHARGFTLLEVLVALAILATALTAGFRAVGMATGNAPELEQRILADWVAQNRLSEHRALGDFPEVGRSEGVVKQGGYAFKWHEEIKPTPNALFRRIDVKVMLDDGSDHALSSMAGFIVSPLR